MQVYTGTTFIISTQMVSYELPNFVVTIFVYTYVDKVSNWVELIIFSANGELNFNNFLRDGFDIQSYLNLINIRMYFNHLFTL